ncbi:hypothetical protein DV738_g5340, partial [Chaetothyriales sp. CBS 135597]
MAPPLPPSPRTPPTLTPAARAQDGSTPSTAVPTPAPSPVPPPVPVETHPNRGAFKLSIPNRNVSAKRRQRHVWKKLLWIKQHGYPDNYTDTDTFLDHLQRNPRLRPYDFWPLVADSTVIVQHVCSVAIFVSVYAGIYQGRLLPTTVFTCGTIATLAGWIIWDRWMCTEENERLAAAVKGKQAAADLVDDGASTSSGGSGQAAAVVTGQSNGHMNGHANGKPAGPGLGLRLSTTNLGAKNKETKTSNHAQSLSRSSLQSISPIDPLNETMSLLIYFALLGLSPILKSLTKSTSSDSIWALATWLLIINIFFFDYGSHTPATSPTARARSESSADLASPIVRSDSSVPISSHTPQFPSSLSTNAALMASTVLASRLPSAHAVFSLTLFSIQVFGLFPVFRRHLRHVSFPLHVLLTAALIVLATSGLGLILSQSYTHTHGDCNYCLSWIWHVVLRSMVGTLLFGSSTVFIMGACSWWLIGLQRYKNVVIGPWDRAKPRAGDDVPGAGWKNKKAQEEKHRALEWLVDRDFSLEAFGDVVLLGKQQRGEE